MKRIRHLLILLGCWPGLASALGAGDAGTYAAVDEDGRFLEKVLRVSYERGKWRFEDRQPDGSWLDVSCHGGCDHRPSTDKEIEAFFGEAPLPGMSVDCVHNREYAFCHGLKTVDGETRDLFALVVRIEKAWHPVALIRVPGEPPDAGPDPAPPRPRLDNML